MELIEQKFFIGSVYQNRMKNIENDKLQSIEVSDEKHYRECEVFFKILSQGEMSLM